MISRRKLMQGAALGPAVLARAEASSNRPLRYLQIGTGHAHANKIEVYAESEDWDVIGIVEEDKALREKARGNPAFNVHSFLEWGDGSLLGDIDVVGVETRIDRLLDYAHLAVEAGCHVHLDKPAGSDWATYEDLMQKADAADLVVQMGYMYRYNPAVLLLQRMLKAGWFGEIFETHAVMSKVIPPASRAELGVYSGGTMFELGCHIIDLTLGVLGAPEKVAPFSRRVIDTPDDDLNDNMLAVLEYPKATATVRTTGLEVGGTGRRHITVCGTFGTCHIQPLDRPEMKLFLDRDRQFEGEERVFRKGATMIPFQPPYRRYVGDAAALAQVVRGEIENPFPSSHDLAVQRTVLEASQMDG
ncbi:MAG: Gfo/Idh/MocA family oxidoreductase [Verrucomicrobiota bacterium]